MPHSAFGLAPVELLQNPGFEHGLPPDPWIAANGKGAPIIVQAAKSGVTPHAGNWMVVLAGTNNDHDTLRQTVIIPSGAASASVSFWWSIKSTGNGSDPSPLDTLSVRLLDFDGNPLAALAALTSASAKKNWTASGALDVTAFKGQVVQLEFEAATNGAKPTFFFIDDASLQFVPAVIPNDLDLAFINPRTGCRGGPKPPPGEISGVVPLEVVASASDGVSSLKLRLDGSEIAAVTGKTRLLVNFDSTTLSPGEHTLEAEAVSASGLIKRCPIPIVPTQLLRNGDFEAPASGQPDYWNLETSQAVDANAVFLSLPDVAPLSGNRAAVFGHVEVAATASEAVCFPAGASIVTVSLYARVSAPDPGGAVLATLTAELVDPLDLAPPVPLVFLSNLDSTTVDVADPGGIYTIYRADLDTEALGLRGKIRILRLVYSPGTTASFVVDAIGATSPIVAAPSYPSIWIESPGNGEMVPGGELLVTGQASSAAGQLAGTLGVSIEGRPAAFDLSHAGTPDDPARWTVAIPVSSVDAKLVLHAVVTDGVLSNCAETEVTVNGFLPRLALRAVPAVAYLNENGFARIEFEWDAPGAVLLEFDFDYDGTDTIDPALADSFTDTFDAPGRYVVTMVADYPDGSHQTVRAAATVRTKEALDAQVQVRWATLKSALQAGGVEGAVANFNGQERQKYRDLMIALGPSGMSTLAAKMAQPYLSISDEGFIVYSNDAPEIVEGVTVIITHDIYFEPDVDGILRISIF